jgi:hypothetical protein
MSKDNLYADEDSEEEGHDSFLKNLLLKVRDYFLVFFCNFRGVGWCMVVNTCI